MSQLSELFKFPGGKHFAVLLIFTAVEVAGLAIWLEFQNAGFLVLGACTLFGFLLVEHIVSQQDHTGRAITKQELGSISIFSAVEVLIWVGWILLIPINPALAAVFFLVGLFVEHQFSDNVKKGISFFHFAKPGNLVFIGLVIFTISEVAGATIWVSQGLIAVLIIGSLLEHYIAGNVARLEE